MYIVAAIDLDDVLLLSFINVRAVEEVCDGCRTDYGACSIAPSISSPIPGMPHGKLANVKSVQLADNFMCKIVTSPLRTCVCASLQANRKMCFTHRDAAFYLIKLEAGTAP